MIRERVCRTCGTKFDGGPRAWYCPGCRKERQRKQQKESRDRKKLGKTRKIGSVDYCVVCGGPYTVESGLQKYCKICADDAVKEIDRAQSREWNAKNANYEERKKQRSLSSAPITCVICGKQFVPSSSAKTCSAECSAELKRKLFADYEKKNADYRREYQKNRVRRKIDAMSEEEREAFRVHKNEVARKNYRKRKERQVEK